MKTTTETKYETSDGRKFLDEVPAKVHEVGLLVEKLTNNDDVTITAAHIKRLMAAHPQKFIDMLDGLTE